MYQVFDARQAIVVINNVQSLKTTLAISALLGYSSIILSI